MSFAESGSQGLFRMNTTQFDFNLRFEQVFLSIIPSAVFIVAALWRALSAMRQPLVVFAPPAFVAVKLAATAVHAVLELGLLVLVAAGGFQATRTQLVSAALRLAAALCAILLSFADHGRSPRPSIILSTYLLLVLILDAAQARTLFLLSADDPRERTYSAVFVAGVAVRLAVLLLESRGKARWVRWADGQARHSPEETSGVFSLGVFSWLNAMLLTGYCKAMAEEDLFPLDGALEGSRLHAAFAGNLRAARLGGGGGFALLRVLAWTMRGTICLAVVPRLCLLGFTLSQPFFIERLLEALSRPGGGAPAADISYGLVGAALLIYAGMAVSTAFYGYYHHRTLTMSRAMLVTEVYRQSTRLRTSDDAALTLMSTDWEHIRDGFKAVHDVWASLVQVGLAAWLLHRHLGGGPVFLVPLGVVLVAFAGVAVVGRLADGAQRAWMAADAAGTMGATRAFTSLSWLVLLTLPLGIVFQQVPLLVGANACLGRIQEFLARERHSDFRRVVGHDDDGETDSEKDRDRDRDLRDGPAIVIVRGKFGWERERSVLQDVNVTIAQSSLNMIVGPVGSGKSTFCKAVLGEAAFNEGTVTLAARHPHVGYCDQRPFLFNGSIRDNIIGQSSFNVQRYNEVIEATALRFDLGNLPQGDETSVGSDGITLSGGQKQRVALARVLYLETTLLVLDDVFSGLDADTEELVFRQVLGPGGLLRKRQATVLLCTHSVRHLPAADHVIALGAGRVVEQGTFAELMAAADGYVGRLGVKACSGSNSDAESEETVAAPEKAEDAPPPPFDPIAAIKDSEAAPADAVLARQQGDATVYKHYAVSMGVLTAMTGAAFTAAYGFFENYPTIWLKYWSADADAGFRHHPFGYYAGVYAALMVSAMACLVMSIMLFLVVGVRRAGANLHQNALTTMMGASLSFFAATDAGVITNLFSQDLNLVDTELPMALINCLLALFEALGQACVMITASPYIAITYPFLIALLLLLAKFYLRTSRQLRLLDLEAKSPLYAHFLDTVKGIVSMRAFGFVPEEIAKTADLLNASQRPAYLLVMIQQWLTLVLGIVVAALATGLTALATRLHASSGFAGASMVTLMSFGESLTMIVQFYTRLETSMGAVARLKAFGETVQPEDKGYENVIPAETWPQSGEIKIKNVSASYEQAGPKTEGTPRLALKNINLSIVAGEKIAICGRTGSGKSSFVALLLKLLDPTIDSDGGGVVIDEIALSSIQRSALRQRILAVPQEAVFLPDGSSFQANLDPSEQATALDCEAVLKVVDLWDFVQERGGLGSIMASITFSAGQRQLMSLGRAVLRRRIRQKGQGGVGEGPVEPEGGVLLLDEVSSSVDVETERIIQDVIKREFSKYTVIAVCHRLDMMMDFDRVVVMDMGEIVEVGSPVALAQEKGSRFGDLLKAFIQ
ncbi:ABC transporter, sequence [Cordyceps fumosorosea ARSEF 2679]|uniref:ABC transporter, sequence n=1 Tax=Cordyceps fumosorosea (strain ARSEF 2679) TaxID=1081104 RepID=A0A167NWC7_CORFA|nr:ABC transporter, sequence [Cordyceps fumosorosea ARSEF 2679]OAA56012.1 ABC transporter, sequence [Cordyceps fumosorosea ARSEF 2679]